MGDTLAGWNRWVEHGAPRHTTMEFTCNHCEQEFEQEVRLAYGQVDSTVVCPFCDEEVTE